MGEESLINVLKGFGLTDSEVEVYLFVSRHSAISGTDVARLIGKDKAQVFRTLKSLQAKGLLEATLEVPMRFAPVAFEKVLEYTIKAKKDEAAQIENTKEQLLAYWKGLNNKSLNISLEKFVVIEGPNKIYSKISQMIKETKNQLSIMLTGAEILRIIRVGLFETGEEKISSKVQFKLLTDLPSQNSRATKILLKEIDNTKASFETRTPDLGLGLPHKMLIRDEDEAMFFLSSNQDKSLTEKNQTCLCTNSKVLVQAFREVFEGLWKNSINLHKLKEVETGAIGSKPIGIADSELAQKKSEEVMNSAKKSVLILTSPEGLMNFSNNTKLLKEWSSKSISIRIMAPIIDENFKKAQELMQFCQVRHIPNSFSRSFTLIDGKYLVQSNRPIQNHEETSLPLAIGFTNNLEYVKKTGVMLRELWKNAPAPSTVNMEYIFKESSNFSKSPDGLTIPIRRLYNHKIIDEKTPTEKDIVNRIITATKHTSGFSKEFKAYVSSGQAVIHLPLRFNMPDLLLFAIHFEKQSALGEEDILMLSLWLQTPKGPSYVPVAIVQNNPRATEMLKKVYDKTPAGKNVQFVKNEDIEIRLHGNTFFAGWNKPIPLMPPKYTLPAGCIILETYGQVRTQSSTLVLPSGFKSKIEGNGFYAFVNFLSSAANYAGPGTDGYVARDAIMTTTPPPSNFIA